MYTATTDSIRVTVTPYFLEHQSPPYEDHYAWAYKVTIENLGEETLQLISRYWRIIDAHGHIKEVRGPGVVGEQPVLEPGQHFEYTSGTMLPTSTGIMHGIYHMVGGDGKTLDIAIPSFSLDTPHERSTIN